jgi:hypothetical protein
MDTADTCPVGWVEVGAAIVRISVCTMSEMVAMAAARAAAAKEVAVAAVAVAQLAGAVMEAARLNTHTPD